MRKVWLFAVALLAVPLAIGAVFLGRSEVTTAAGVTVMFGLVGDPADPPAGAGGITRDRSDPGAVVIKRGGTVDFINRSGGMHQVAVYGAGLNFDQQGCGTAASPCANLTTLADIIVLPGDQGWGNFISPPDGSQAKDNPATPENESRAGAGLLMTGPNPVGLTAPQRQSGAIDLSYTFMTPGQYLVICNFKPHFVSYAHATFVLVTE